MELRRISLAAAFAGCVFGAYLLGRHGQAQASPTPPARQIRYYVDPMHPAYRADKPGIAPDCGMQLQPVYADDAPALLRTATHRELRPGAIALDDATRRLIGVQLATVREESAAQSVHVAGRIVPDETRTYTVNTGIDGFVRATYQDSVGTLVKKDQKLASYYAPEFLAAASGFLAATERITGSLNEGNRSIQSYTDRLRNLGMSDLQMNEIRQTRHLPESVDVLSPADGLIVSRSISAGQHFAHETEFYRIADIRRMWVVAEVPATQRFLPRPGELVRITAGSNGRRFEARVSDSSAQNDPGSGTSKLRLDVANAGLALRPQMIADVELPVRYSPAVTVPVDALIDSGNHTRVFVEYAKGVLEPREVQTGWRTGTDVQVLHGLHPGERVAVSSTFLLDSESRLQNGDERVLVSSGSSAKTDDLGRQ